MTPKRPGLLVRYIQQKRCVVFVGAGLSAGAGLPTWNKLLLKGIQELVGALPEGELHQEELARLVEKGKLLEVADFCKEKLGGAYHQFLTDQVRGDLAQLPRTHHVLMHLPFSAWVTTNYDKLLERAYSEVKGGFPKTLTHKDTEALGRLLFDGGQFILKAHGDIDRPETVVLTSRDYSEIIHANPSFNEIFSGLLLTKAVLFVGYSLSDPDFRLLMDRQLTHFKGFIPERFALMTGVGPVERDVLWRTARIQVISYENAKGDHSEVLQFLEALLAEVLPKPVSGPGAVRSIVPAPAAAPPPVAAAPQATQVFSHNLSGPPSARHSVLESLMAQERGPNAGPASTPPASEGEDLGLDLAQVMDAEEKGPSSSAGSQPLSFDSPSPPASEAPRRSTAPHQLFIEWVGGRVQLRLSRGDGVPEVQGAAPTSLNEDVWLSLKRAVERGEKSNAWLYPHFTERLFKEHLPQEVLEALGEQGPSAQAPLVLRLAPEVARFPWELLPFQGEPVCLKRRLVRAPVGISSQARGAPRLRARPRLLLIEGERKAGSAGSRELEDIAKLYPASGFVCTVLRGQEATFGRVMAELMAEKDDELPDLVHYTGEVGQIGAELYLKLPGDMELSAGALRSVLSRGRLPFLVMNAPSSAFAPYGFGVYPAEEDYHRLPVPSSRAAVFEGREGFMDLAIRQGVGAFVGAFDKPGASASAEFMVALHRALATGFPMAEAVLRARQAAYQRFRDDPTALQYVLSGDGDLQLWNSLRSEGPG
ncbi:SIR2 family protein [Hyalangium sp.]|uniref:SIR2 family NAD-dependent protein deacylase n=1 Tax=Hyalangium sp. TaxID=2028555 RepID=UPI002D407A2C|nr:SIR2 family protein [Hyalangium sp.]HYH95957.1 SIR2 family protein [Hyalangium sp.]